MPLLSQRVLAALEAVFVTIRGRLVMPPTRLLTRPLSNVRVWCIADAYREL